MQISDQNELADSGLVALKIGDTATALVCFERLVAEERVPFYCSCLAFCVARERGDYKRAISLCKEAVKQEPKNSQHFLFLGRIHLLAGERKDAVRIFRMGLRHERSVDILRELERLGTRKQPVLPFLRRENPVNRMLGKVMKKIGVR
jgi:predicted Zn-dependent protease